MLTLGELRTQTNQLPDHYEIVLTRTGNKYGRVGATETVPTVFVGVAYGPAPDNMGIPQVWGRPGQVLIKELT